MVFLVSFIAKAPPVIANGCEAGKMMGQRSTRLTGFVIAVLLLSIGALIGVDLSSAGNFEGLSLQLQKGIISKTCLEWKEH
jgi:hypothetical protein